MRFLFNLAYLCLLVLAAPLLAYKALRHNKYRAGWGEKLLGRVPTRNGPRRCVWFHAVSVGEVNLLQTLLTRFEERHPEWDVVISTTTRTGFELAQKKYGGRIIFYAPLDFSWAVSAALRRVRPNLLVLAELEVWPNLVALAKRAGAKVAVVNGRLSEKSFRGYRRIAFLLRETFAALDLVAAQSETYADRFRALGTPSERVINTGSVKFDNAQTSRENPRTVKLAHLAGFAADDIVFLAGSTQDPEEELALAAYRDLAPQHPRLRLVLVPRHPERFAAVIALLERSGIPWQRRSTLETAGANSAARVLLVDTVGELGAWWGTARIAFVGGSMGTRGGQNMLEPAAYGAAVCFGPKTHNFRDVVEMLLAAEAALVVHSGPELTQFVARCLRNEAFANDLGQKAQALVIANQGAADRTMELIDGLIGPAAEQGTQVRLDTAHNGAPVTTKEIKSNDRGSGVSAFLYSWWLSVANVWHVKWRRLGPF